MRTKATLLVAASVALAVLLSFGIAVKDAKADALLFPFIVKSPTVSTLISVVNTAEPVLGNQALADQKLHYQYWFKAPGTGAVQTAACNEQNFQRPTSKDDIVVFDAAGKVNSGKKLFNDPTDYTQGNVENFNLSTQLPAARAFLIVDNNIPQAFTIDGLAATNADGTLYGEAVVVELVGGAAWGYIAYNASGGVRRTSFQGVSFADGFDVLGEVIGNNEVTQTTWMPPANLGTKLFITPVDAGLFDEFDAGQRFGGLGALVSLCITPNQRNQDFADNGGCFEMGIFDADENPLSFNNEAHVHCTGAVDIKDLIGTALDDAGNTAGWSYIVVNNDVRNSGAILNKLEFTTTGVTLDGVTVPGTLNSAVWLRDSESLSQGDNQIVACGQGALPCGGGINCIHNVTTFNPFPAEFDPFGFPFGPFNTNQCDRFPQVPDQMMKQASVQ